jgi:PPM family protein phosphatase
MVPTSTQEPGMAAVLRRWIEKILGMFKTHAAEDQQETPVYQSLQQTRKNKKKNKKGFGSKRNTSTQVLQPAYTRRLKPEQLETISTEIRADAPSLLAWYALTDTGMVRPHNEDNFSCMDSEYGTLFIVADGMGGHDAGEVASQIAVDTVCQEVRIGKDRNPLDIITNAVQQANAAVRREGKLKGSNMGTTLSLAFIVEDVAYIANVGDSRVYWIENGSISQITEDHSLVARLTAAGKLTKEEARKHPQSNLLFRTIGSDATIKVDTYQVGLRKGGNLLLCTDGLWGEIADKAIHQVFAAEQDAEKTATSLVRIANENGGMDNITAVVVKVI